MKIRLGILVGLLMAFLSLYPQFYLQYQRGENYNGATFHFDFDESNYAAYLQALIDGRPRQNSIYQGGDEPHKTETLYTIQFIPPYLAAIFARPLGLSSESAFLFISVFCAFLSGLAVFWFIYKVTENPYFAAAGTLFVLIFGANIAGGSVLKETLGLGKSAFHLTFLRRYTPAMAFPVIFVLLGSIWFGLKSTKPNRTYLYSIIVIVCFAFLVYSYFFYWTAILAWLCFVALLNFFFLRENRNWSFWATIFGGILLAMIPYFLLLSNRNSTTDSFQALEQTRKVLLFRPTLLFGLLVFLFTIIFLKANRIKLRTQTTVFISSFTLLPLLVFNQQVITGYSLQPSHYDRYILNYLALLGFVLLINELFKANLAKVRPFVWALPMTVFFIWGLIEMNYTIKHRFFYNIRRDEALPVNRHLAEIGKADFINAKSQITLNFDPVQGDNQPSLAPHGVLWAIHLLSTGNLSTEETKKRYFLYLYLQNKDANWLRLNLRQCSNEVCLALMGWWSNRTLVINYQEINDQQIDSLTNEYQSFIDNLDATEIFSPTISYIIAPSYINPDFTKIVLWYEIESKEQFGNFMLYKIRPLK
jgi:hypothetical protein